MTSPDEMPRHKPVRWLIECSCGQTVDRALFERHRAREPHEIGEWIGQRMLDDIKKALEPA